MTVEQLQAENARLKTEVEHLMIFCNSTLIPSKDLQAENSRLKAEVERLRKAGDKMAKTLEKDQQRYNGCPSAEAEMWWIARDGGCP